MTTTTDKAKTPRSKRTSVPAPEPAAPSLSVVDVLAAQAQVDVRPLALAALHPHPHNPRRDLGDLSELTDSIHAHGVRQNLVVVPNPDEVGGYRVVIGHRRHAAALLAGLDHVPAAVDVDLDEAGQLELMLLENLQRADLTAIEEADGYQGLLDLGLSVTAIATRTGRSRGTVHSRLRLQDLPEKARTALHEHRATLEDAAKVASFADIPELHDRLAAALGTKNFAYTLTDAEYQKAQRRKEAEAAAMLKAAGIPVVDGALITKWGPDATHDSLGTIPPLRADRLATLPEGTVAAKWYGSFELYAPHDPARMSPRDAVALERRTAEEEANRPVNEFLTLTSQTREAFLTALLSGARPITRAHETAIIQWVARFLAVTGTLDRSDAELEGWAALSGFSGDVADWVDSVVPAYPLLAVAAASFEDFVGDHEPDAWGHSLISREQYARGWHTAAFIAWYELLEQLGYPVSDVERAALTPPPDGEAES